MKKIFTSCLILSLCFLLSGCGNNAKTEVNNSSSNTNKQETNTQTPTVEEKENINLSNIKSKLENLGLDITEEQVYYQMVGATNGTKLYSGEYRVEIYQFDKTSEEYKKAESSQKLELSEDMSFDAVVKNGYAYIIDDEFPQHDQVIDLLKQLR